MRGGEIAKQRRIFRDSAEAMLKNLGPYLIMASDKPEGAFAISCSRPSFLEPALMRLHIAEARRAPRSFPRRCRVLSERS
jgi:hypothetical protein